MTKEVITIAKNMGKKSAEFWAKLKGEYITGSISMRKLAKKYNISPNVLMNKACKEKWSADREKVISDGLAKVEQKASQSIVDSVVTAGEIKLKLLERLKRMEEKYPFDATEVRSRVNGNIVIFRIKDLTSAYKDLTSDMNLNGNTEQVRIVIDV